MRSQCQHTNTHIMEYRLISSDSHLSKHYVVIPHNLVILEMALTRWICACHNHEGVTSQANLKKRANDGYLADSSWLILCICHNLIAHWFKIRLTSPKSPVLGVAVAGRLSDCLIRLSIQKATLVGTGFSIYFGNSAISSITRLCGMHMDQMYDRVIFHIIPISN